MDLNKMADVLGLDVEDIQELLDLFVETTRVDLEELKEALKVKDAARVHSKTHSIKGASGNLGLSGFYKLAKKADDLARDGILDGLEPLVDEFADKFHRFADEIADL